MFDKTENWADCILLGLGHHFPGATFSSFTRKTQEREDHFKFSKVLNGKAKKFFNKMIESGRRRKE